jgi:aspartyl-tRNA(Asn)/glutamyl-tRNA(Gln) amidotransferase subunit C
MSLKIDLDNICNLANLELAREDKKLLEPQMIKIVRWVNKLEELGIDPSKGELDSPVFLSLPLREDKIKSSLPAQEALASSPEKSKGFIKVPKVIEEK